MKTLVFTVTAGNLGTEFPALLPLLYAQLVFQPSYDPLIIQAQNGM